MAHCFNSLRTKKSRWSMKRKLHEFLNPLEPEQVDLPLAIEEADIEDGDEDDVVDCSSLYGDAEGTVPLFDCDDSSISNCSDRSDLVLSDTDEQEDPEDDLEQKEVVKLHPLCDITLTQSLEAVTSVASKHAFSNAAVVDVLQLIKLHLPKTTSYPSTFYKLQKHLGSTEPFYDVRYYCGLCEILLSEEYVCPTCNSQYEKAYLRKEGYFFVEFSLEKQLRCILNSPDVQKELKIFFEADIDSTTCCNIRSGRSYLRQVSGCTDLSFSFNTDGVNIFNSSNRRSLYPLLLVINELPYFLSKKYYLLGGLWFREGKPNFNLFLGGSIEQMNCLRAHGMAWNNLSGVRIHSTLHFPICPVDCPVRCQLQGIKQFNGCYGCTWCDHPGKSIKKGGGTARVFIDPTAAGALAVFGTHPHVVIKERNDEEFRRAEAKGQKCVSPVFNLEGFNLADGFVVDPMHCVDLGVVSSITSWWLEKTREEYYIGDRIEEIEGIVRTIRVPGEIQRNFKPLGKRKEWKASQWRSWLYVLPVVLEGILVDPFLSHFVHLSRAIYLLSQSTVSWESVSQAEDFISSFVRDGYDLYGEEFYFYNVHQLSHLSACVKRWGPLWGLSNYRFESFNGDLKKFIKGSNGVEVQIANRFVRKMLLRNCESFQQADRLEYAIVNPKNAVVDEETLYILPQQYHFNEITQSSIGIIGFHTFKARQQGRESKKCDEVISLHSKELGYIRQFLQLRCRCASPCDCDKIFVDVDCFRVLRKRGYRNTLYTSSTEFERKIVPITSVKSIKFFVIKASSRTYFVQVPNLFECS